MKLKCQYEHFQPMCSNEVFPHKFPSMVTSMKKIHKNKKCLQQHTLDHMNSNWTEFLSFLILKISLQCVISNSSSRWVYDALPSDQQPPSWVSSTLWPDWSSWEGIHSTLLWDLAWRPLPHSNHHGVRCEWQSWGLYSRILHIIREFNAN